ncbi:PPOX class F420-dependent oxidoreductase [Planobispora rosea]|uniref:PPOX class F420-dependent oxidoreductase n=1 Tax=Planobispora rosea TaxID=35762 RepID=A0A8J3RXB6_PLARO|nr:TIGR03668 family PPOX class F420-dependent oxidoreductase [Planobispora rosea]GGS74081.1 PPOX class F420-dependent oxidoreductase [Planobispora rosea]GIH81702.1 PPOX class F420-dependent oxidoreductase [Planobispora rosea]
MDQAEARRRFALSRVARLATADRRGIPHLVPVTYAVEGDTIVFAVDHKPKRTTDLRRLRNIAENDRVCLLADHYADDWSRLWWVRADGRAAVTEDPAARAHALTLLAARYPQYRDRPPEGPVVAVTVESWRGWSYTEE